MANDCSTCHGVRCLGSDDPPSLRCSAVPSELWRGKYDKLKNDTDRQIRALVDEADRNLNTLGHQYALIDRLRWALALCKGKMAPDDWDDDIKKFSEST